MVSPNLKAAEHLARWRVCTSIEKKKIASSPTCKLAGSGSPVHTRTRRKENRLPFNRLAYHKYCGDWCSRLRQTEAERVANKKMYRCKTKDAKLYSILLNKIERFITEQALDEVGHGMDTLVNESFNNSVAWVAPKNKVYSSSDSLRNRIAVCLGINGLGTYEYYKLLFERLNISMPIDVNHSSKKRKRMVRHNN